MIFNDFYDDNNLTYDMILQLDDNILMLIELLPSLMIILLIFLIQRCV